MLVCFVLTQKAALRSQVASPKFCVSFIYIYEQHIFEKIVMLFLNDLYNRVIYSSVLEGKLSSTD